jgi:two-component system, OmpR family, response regulator CpxR
MKKMAESCSAQRAAAQAQLLLVDDDVALGELVSEYAAYEGYTISTANTGELGLRIVGRKAFALVILDVMLPGIDGFEVLERLRRFSQVPVLMLTTRGAASDRIRGLKSGADDYLPNPFEPDELFARVKSILRRIRPSLKGLSFISIGDIEMDEPFRRVTRGGEAVELTGAEFSLLQLLVSRPGTTLSRQELIPRVLSRQESGIDRSIDSLVSNLRRKLGPFPDGSERIRSVRGVGYVYVIAEEEA